MHNRITNYIKAIACMAITIVITLSGSANVWANISATNNKTGYQFIISDSADFFTDDEEEELAELMKDITQYGNILVATTTSHSYSSSEAYAVGIYENAFDYGSSGAVFVIDRDLNNIYLACEGSAKKVINNSRCDVICDNTYIYATSGYGYDYYTCTYKTLEQVYTLLDGGRIAQPMKYVSNLVIAIVLAMLVNFIVVMVFSHSRKPSASQLLNGTFNNVAINNTSARFMNQTKTYSPRSSGSSGGSGGGGHSGGGGGHSGGGHGI